VLKAVFAILKYDITEGHSRGGHGCLPLSPSFFALRVELRVDLDDAGGSASGAARFLFRQRRYGTRQYRVKLGEWYMMAPWAAFERFWGV
jgi:hypothetical protein